MQHTSDIPGRKEAAAFLERLQQSVYSKLGTLPKHMRVKATDDEEFDRTWYEQRGGFREGQTFEEFRAEMQSHRAKERQACPTPFEDPTWYSLLAGMIEEITVALGFFSERPPEKYLFGTLPTGSVNAVTLRVPNSDFHLILLEDGLFGFANLMCKAVARVFPFKRRASGEMIFGTDKNECLANIRANTDVTERFFETVVAYIVGGHPHKARPYLLDATYDALARTMRASMEIFVLCHEFGHLISGHLFKSETKAALMGDTKAEQIMISWAEEFEADIRGLEILLAVMRRRGYDLSLSFWGADLFFGCIDTVERAVQILAHGAWQEEGLPSESHPPTPLRRQMLCKALKRSFDAEHADAALELTEVVAFILDVFWNQCEPLLAAMYRDGVKLAPAWRA